MYAIRSYYDIKDSHLTAAHNGSILNRYFNNSELVNPGLPVFDLADLFAMRNNFV